MEWRLGECVLVAMLVSVFVLLAVASYVKVKTEIATRATAEIAEACAHTKPVVEAKSDNVVVVGSPSATEFGARISEYIEKGYSLYGAPYYGCGCHHQMLIRGYR